MGGGVSLEFFDFLYYTLLELGQMRMKDKLLEYQSFVCCLRAWQFYSRLRLHPIPYVEHLRHPTLLQFYPTLQYQRSDF